MYRLIVVLILTTTICQAQPMTAAKSEQAALQQALGFELEPINDVPGGWMGPAKVVFSDEVATHSGRRAVRIERTETTGFAGVMKTLPLDFAGQRIELRGFARTQDVSRAIGLWLRQDGAQPNLEFASTQGRGVRGTTGWNEYSVTLPLNPAARSVAFGFLVTGSGKAWADDLQLLVDGKPVWEAPKAEWAITALDRDHEFDAGSKITLAALSPAQVDNLATLGRVWGFLKYHHPKAASGQVHWDYELFRILPSILAAPDRVAANASLVRWIDALGGSEAGGAPAKLKDDLHLKPDTDWLRDQAQLGTELSEKLALILANRPLAGRQFYVSQVSGVGNPVFEHELPYAQVALPDAGFQLLALYRYWNIIRYWSPYRDLTGEDWDAVLREYIPRLALAADATAYKRELLTLIARVHDTHANLWSSLDTRPPGGDCQLPVAVRFVQGQALVARTLAAGDTRSNCQVGDIIESIDGTPVARLVESWAPYYAASNEPTRLRDIARTLTNGPAGPVQLGVRRAGQTITFTDTRVPIKSLASQISRTHDLPGEAFRLLSKDVAYLRLSGAKDIDAKECITRAAGTKGLIIDIRNYPSEFMVFKLGALLVDHPVEFVRFTNADLANPGAFHFLPPLKLVPAAPHYAGRVVILIDEISQSQAEYTAMAFRVAPGALVVGSTTAGADGNVSPIPLPGGLRTMISGIGVFYPDKRPTQRVGIVPDIEVKPTIEGIKAGRDEVLEAALQQILGPAAAADLRQLVPAPANATDAPPAR